MEGSATAEDVGAPPESWEVANLDASMRFLMLSSAKDSNSTNNISNLSELDEGSISGSGSTTGFSSGSGDVSEDLVNSVDQFLRDALQNPRERLSVLRMEQEVEKFIRDPTREQMEFQQLPTSYLRLAAHRVAQHYSLQSMVLLDNNQPDGSGSRIIVRKTSNLQLPLIRLADIPVNLPAEDTGVVKVAIKQRPQRGSLSGSSSNSHSTKSNNAKSVEERTEEYKRARDRIFNPNRSNASPSDKPESELRMQKSSQQGSLGIMKVEERILPGGGSHVNAGRHLLDSSAVSTRPDRSRTEKETIGRSKTNNKVAIFQDREVDCKDPDYDRSYDRYTQRFDPGFGFNGGPYTIQPMYPPALNYNAELPQLGSNYRPPISSEHRQHIPGLWAVPSAPPGIGYGRPEIMMPTFIPNHVNAHSNSALYLHSTQYPCQYSGLPFIQSREAIHQSFSQFHQQQPDTSFGLARPR